MMIITTFSRRAGAVVSAQALSAANEPALVAKNSRRFSCINQPFGARRNTVKWRSYGSSIG
jgi:hypothetical protein